MTTHAIQVETIRGYTITIEPAPFSWRFEIIGENGEFRTTADSHKEAKAAIEDRIKAIARESKAAFTPRMCLKDDGSRTNIRGINSNTGRALSDDASYDGDLFPDVPWIMSALVEMATVRKRVNDLREQIRPFAVRAKVGWGRIEPSAFNSHLAQFQKALDDARRKAEAPATKRKESADVE